MCSPCSTVAAVAMHTATAFSFLGKLPTAMGIIGSMMLKSYNMAYVACSLASSLQPFRCDTDTADEAWPQASSMDSTTIQSSHTSSCEACLSCGVSLSPSTSCEGADDGEPKLSTSPTVRGTPASDCMATLATTPAAQQQHKSLCQAPYAGVVTNPLDALEDSPAKPLGSHQAHANEPTTVEHSNQGNGCTAAACLGRDALGACAKQFLAARRLVQEEASREYLAGMRGKLGTLPVLARQGGQATVQRCQAIALPHGLGMLESVRKAPPMRLQQQRQASAVAGASAAAACCAAAAAEAAAEAGLKLFREYRMQKEAHTACPLVVRPLAFDAAGGCSFTMEYCPGGDLMEALVRDRDRVRDGSSEPLEVSSGRLPSIAFSLLASLERLHERGIVHRDIKPENVYLSRCGLALLGDFGLAERLGPEGVLTQAHLVGTQGYLAPELQEQVRVQRQAAALRASPHAAGAMHACRYTYRAAGDVYAAGLVLAVCAAAPAGMAVSERGIDLRELLEVRLAGSALGRLLQGLLERDPGMRLSAAQALLHDYFAEWQHTVEGMAAWECERL